MRALGFRLREVEGQGQPALLLVFLFLGVFNYKAREFPYNCFLMN